MSTQSTVPCALYHSTTYSTHKSNNHLPTKNEVIINLTYGPYSLTPVNNCNHNVYSNVYFIEHCVGRNHQSVMILWRSNLFPSVHTNNSFIGVWIFVQVLMITINSFNIWCFWIDDYLYWIINSKSIKYWNYYYNYYKRF